MDQKLLNRFEFFSRCDLEQLLAFKEEVERDMDYIEKNIDTCPSQQRNEFYEDLKYDRDRLTVINYYIGLLANGRVR